MARESENALRQSGVQLNSNQRTLSGRTFLITRTAEGNASEKKMLEALGAEVIEFPAIEISPPFSWKDLDSVISGLQNFDWVIFTSANGVKIFFERMKELDPQSLEKLRNRATTRFACVGPYTKRSLEDLGFHCSLQPEEFLTSSLGNEMADSMRIMGRRVLLARAEVASREIADILRKAGAAVTEVAAYRTILASHKLDLGILERITDITLTSPSTVEGLLNSVDASAINARNIGIHCIGPITALKAEKRGLHVKTSASVHTVDGMIDEIAMKKNKKVKE